MNRLNVNSYPKSILISLMGSLGDVARGMSLLKALKAGFPGCRIVWLIEPKCYELIKLSPDVDRVILFRRGSGLTAIGALISELRSEKFDLCIDLQRHFKSGLFSRLSGAKRILGFDRANSKEFNWIFSSELISDTSPDIPKIEHYWKFLQHLGLNVPSSAKVELKTLSRTELFSKLNLDFSGDFLLLVLGSSWPSKDWTFEGYVSLIKAIQSVKPEMKFVLSGGPDNKPLADRIMNTFSTQKNPVFSCCGKTSLEDLVSLVSQSKLVFGPDSGPGHLAAMLEVPFVGVFGPTDPGRTAPYGSKVVFISARLGCRPCYKRRCPGLANICMKLIRIEDIQAAIMKFIS